VTKKNEITKGTTTTTTHTERDIGLGKLHQWVHGVMIHCVNYSR